jgi:ATP-binding cassette subfamily A (ABC1) protein 5
MFTFLIPLYYFVSKLAEEKESKAREGMKMMGLKDSTYFLSWFIFFSAIMAIMSLTIAIMTAFNVFNHSNFLLVFLLSFFYGMTLFGFAILVVSFIPS